MLSVLLTDHRHPLWIGMSTSSRTEHRPSASAAASEMRGMGARRVAGPLARAKAWASTSKT